eukprot:GHVU01148123.1.p1 GENE.GHVU01148123.1~~GHVU01148123.1.p1  ORF type:complete len:179 (+),score=20.36 GHVU01148123.1:3-539(+)
MGRYRGEVRNGRPHGLGVLRYRNGSIYEGEFRDGSEHGLGVYRHTNGNIGYAGQWQDRLYHGFGLRRGENGSVAYAGWFNRSNVSQGVPPEDGSIAAAEVTGEPIAADGETDKARAHRMAEEAVRIASVDMMTEAAELMGQVAMRAEETGQRIRNFQRMGRYRGEVRNGRPHGLGVLR